MRRLGVPTLALLMLLSSPAWGQGKGRAAADALFREGRAAFDKGDFPRACEKFEASQKADPAVGTLLNLALCEERLGKLGSARRHVDELIPQLPPKDERLTFAKDLAAKIEARMPRLTVALAAGAPPDSTIAVDGKPARPGEALIVEPGDHEIVVTAPGRAEARVRVKLAEGQREEKALGPGPSLGPSPDEQPKSNSAGIRRTIGFVLGGVGVAGFIGAGITGGLLLSRKGEVDARCPNRRCDAEGLRLLEEARSTPILPVNTAMWITGIVGVSAGAVLVLTSGIIGGSKDAKPSAAVAPLVLPGGAGVGAAGVF